jgi:hypothetical protein
MKVVIVSMRNLILSGIVFFIVLVAGIVLLVQDPLDVSGSYKPDAPSVPTSGNGVSKPFGSEKPLLNMDVKVDGNTAEVKLNTQNFRFVKEDDPAKAPVFGEGHAHLYIDGEAKGMVYGPEFLIKKLPQGEHEIRVELSYSNHLPYKVEAVETIQVK